MLVPFRGSNSGLVPLRVSSIKRYTAGAFAVPFRVLSQKIMTGDI